MECDNLSLKDIFGKCPEKQNFLFSSLSSHCTCIILHISGKFCLPLFKLAAPRMFCLLGRALQFLLFLLKLQFKLKYGILFSSLCVLHTKMGHTPLFTIVCWAIITKLNFQPLKSYNCYSPALCVLWHTCTINILCVEKIASTAFKMKCCKCASRPLGLFLGL